MRVFYDSGCDRCIEGYYGPQYIGSATKALTPYDEDYVGQLGDEGRRHLECYPVHGAPDSSCPSVDVSRIAVYAVESAEQPQTCLCVSVEPPYEGKPHIVAVFTSGLHVFCSGCHFRRFCCIWTDGFVVKFYDLCVKYC